VFLISVRDTVYDTSGLGAQGMSRTGKWVAAAATVLALGTLLPSGYALAAGRHARDAGDVVFIAGYEHGAQTEAELLQKAQALAAADPFLPQFLETVQTLNQQVADLYTLWQALAGLAAHSSPTPRTGAASLLRSEKAALLLDIAADKGRLDSLSDANDKSSRLTRKALKYATGVLDRQLRAVSASLQQVSAGISGPPLFSGMSSLENAILHLQHVAILYTTIWVYHSQPAALVAAQASGLAYASSTVAPPSAGQSPVIDAVAAAPAVTDQAGNTLPDTGTYSLAGPPGASGVSVDSTTGALTVEAGATAGDYTVTYAQDGVADSVTITVT
jgi:hypothetical protein